MIIYRFWAGIIWIHIMITLIQRLFKLRRLFYLKRLFSWLLAWAGAGLFLSKFRLEHILALFGKVKIVESLFGPICNLTPMWLSPSGNVSLYLILHSESLRLIMCLSLACHTNLLLFRGSFSPQALLTWKCRNVVYNRRGWGLCSG